MRNIIIDCDPGHDDVMAILTAYANNDYFNILGITTVAGNQTVEKVTNNILKVQDYLGMSIPVSAGYDAPIIKDADPQPAAHGISGMDGPVLPQAKSKVTGMHAIDFMRKTIEENDKVTIVALAPLTNVALLLKTYPYLKEKIECIALMGGSINGGNIRTKSEFNIYHDPEAARIVYRSGVKVIMAPIEACRVLETKLADLEKLNNGKKCAQMCYELLDFFSNYSKTRSWDYTTIFDLVPVVYLMKPELFEAEEMYVDIELDGLHTQGMTVCADYPIAGIDYTTTVITGGNTTEYNNILFAAIEKIDNSIN